MAGPICSYKDQKSPLQRQYQQIGFGDNDTRPTDKRCLHRRSATYPCPHIKESPTKRMVTFLVPIGENHRKVPRLTTWEVVHEDFGWHEEWQQGVLCMRTLLDFEQDLVKYGQLRLKKVGLLCDFQRPLWRIKEHPQVARRAPVSYHWATLANWIIGDWSPTTLTPEVDSGCSIGQLTPLPIPYQIVVLEGNIIHVMWLASTWMRTLPRQYVSADKYKLVPGELLVAWQVEAWGRDTIAKELSLVSVKTCSADHTVTPLIREQGDWRLEEANPVPEHTLEEMISRVTPIKLSTVCGQWWLLSKPSITLWTSPPIKALALTWRLAQWIQTDTWYGLKWNYFDCWRMRKYPHHHNGYQSCNRSRS